jgi:mercuric ion transport protein
MEEEVRNQNRKAYRLSWAAILPALGVSLTWFCCLPIAVGTLGAGLAAAGASLAPLRPYLTAAAVASLGLAFYQAYKPRKADCAPGKSCGTGAGRTRQRALLWIIAALTLILLTTGDWSSWVIYWSL